MRRWPETALVGLIGELQSMQKIGALLRCGRSTRLMLSARRCRLASPEASDLMDAHRCQAQCHAPLLHEAERFQAGDICFSKIIRADVAVGDVEQRDCFLRVQ